ncbi:MAG: hypothetical protein KDA80_03180 [Planctomycetaceae bacterium]|nr:hypothetical protein [Planctomycetaceae bacterium]
MKTIAILLTATLIFAGSAGSVYYYRTNLKTEPVAAQSSAQIPVADDTRDENGPNGLPVSERAKPVTVEELLRLSMSLKDREARLTQKEEQLAEESIQQQVVIADIQKEHDNVGTLQSQLDATLQRAELLMEQLHQGRQAIIDERSAAESQLDELQSTQIQFDQQHQENTKKLAQWIQNMDENKAAEVLREMADEGQMETAVQILSFFEERDAARILSTLDDAKLIQDFVTQFRNLKSPDKKTPSHGRR